MRISQHRQVLGAHEVGLVLERITAVLAGVLLLVIGNLFSLEVVSAKTIYSYIDEQGTPVLTDSLENIPERYRAKVQATEEAPKAPAEHAAAVGLQQKVAGWAHNIGVDVRGFTSNISGLTHYQSRVLTLGGMIAAICFLVRFFLGSEMIRFLALWCLIMLGFVVPALLFTSQDAPLDRLSGEAGKIQERQQEHLQRTQ